MVTLVGWLAGCCLFDLFTPVPMDRFMDTDQILCSYHNQDSMDPETYKKNTLAKFSDSLVTAQDETTASSSSEELKEWEYIRVDALGFLPGLVCPHHDRVQSNGVLRAHDFDRLLLQSKDERGIAIDHWAALIIDGEDFQVMSLEGKEGSVKDGNEFVTDGSGIPGIWIKEVVVQEDGQDLSLIHI